MPTCLSRYFTTSSDLNAYYEIVNCTGIKMPYILILVSKYHLTLCGFLPWYYFCKTSM